MSSPKRTRGPAKHRKRRRHVALPLALVALVVAAIMAAGVFIHASSTTAATPVVTATAVAATTAWHDEFTGKKGGAPSSARWKFNLGAGGWGNNELQDYTKKNAKLDGKSHLAITAVIDDTKSGNAKYTSSSLSTKASFGYGTLSARIKLPDGKGLLPAFWLIGSDVKTVGWPESGEIDVVETPNTTTTSFHNIHGPSTSDSTVAVNAESSVTHSTPLSAGWHVYSVTRTSGLVEITLDGTVVASLTPASAPSTMKWVFDQPFRAALTLAIGGTWPGDPDATTPTTSTMLVDWMRFTPAS